jgi:hypothetical protein
MTNTALMTTQLSLRPPLYVSNNIRRLVCITGYRVFPCGVYALTGMLLFCSVVMETSVPSACLPTLTIQLKSVHDLRHSATLDSIRVPC